MSILNEFPPVAQLDRVSDYESEGHVFESRRAGQPLNRRHELRAFFLYLLVRSLSECIIQ